MKSVMDYQDKCNRISERGEMVSKLICACAFRKER